MKTIILNIYRTLPKTTRIYIKKKYLAPFWKKYYKIYLLRIQNNEEIKDDLLMKLIKNQELAKQEGIRARARVIQNANWKFYNEKLFKIITN